MMFSAKKHDVTDLWNVAGCITERRYVPRGKVLDFILMDRIMLTSHSSFLRYHPDDSNNLYLFYDTPIDCVRNRG